MTIRNPQMDCLLCHSNKADATGSHFAPAWLIEPTIGPRDLEAAFTIDTVELEIDSHYGRSRLDNPNIIPTQNAHVQDYIFCNDCEKSLGRLESAIAPFLQEKIYHPRYSSQFSIINSVQGFRVKISKHISSAFLHLFIYSVIWRVCLQQRLVNNVSSLHPGIEESMRIFLLSGLHKTIDEIKAMALMLPFSYTFVTADNIKAQSATFINIDPTIDNPTAFFLGKIIILSHLDDRIEVTGKGLQFDKEIQQGKFANKSSKDYAQLVFITEGDWTNANYYMLKESASKWRESAIEKLSISKGVSELEAEHLLKQETDVVVSDAKINHAEAMLIALKNLIANN